MGDMAEIFNAMKEYKKERREARRKHTPRNLEQLTELGIEWRFLDIDQEHCRIANKWDWWPSSGYWKELKGKRKGHGYLALFKILDRELTTQKGKDDDK